jgi:hypothetical protein
MRELVLPYKAVQQANDSDAMIALFQSIYEAAANLAKWDGAALER